MITSLSDAWQDFKVKLSFKLMLKCAAIIGLNNVVCWTGGEQSGKVTICLSTCKVAHSRAVEEMYENSLRM